MNRKYLLFAWTICSAIATALSRVFSLTVQPAIVLAGNAWRLITDPELARVFSGVPHLGLTETYLSGVSRARRDSFVLNRNNRIVTARGCGEPCAGIAFV